MVTLEIGLMTIDMILKPFKVDSKGSSGSDEGANVFLILPFQDEAARGIRIPAYFSIRGREPELTCSPIDAIRSPSYSGTRRVTIDYSEATATKPY